MAINLDWDDSFDPDTALPPTVAQIQPGGFSAPGMLTAAGGAFDTTAVYLAHIGSAKLAKQNAAIAGAQAQSEAQTGADQAEVYRQHLNATLGKEEAQIGASGVRLSGSPLRALANTASIGSQDLSRIQLNSMRKTWGFEVQQAGDLYKARQDAGAATASALGGLITTGAKAYGQWSDS